MEFISSIPQLEVGQEQAGQRAVKGRTEVKDVGSHWPPAQVHRAIPAWSAAAGKLLLLL